MDNLSRAQRRRNMRNIRSFDTLPERILMSELKRKQIYFTKHIVAVPGKPDIVFHRKKLSVFVDSDFWHGRPKHFTMPKSNRNYWRKKILNNRTRDRKVNKTLKKQGWKVIRIWESEIRKNPANCLNKVVVALNANE